MFTSGPSPRPRPRALLLRFNSARRRERERVWTKGLGTGLARREPAAPQFLQLPRRGEGASQGSWESWEGRGPAAWRDPDAAARSRRCLRRTGPKEVAPKVRPGTARL